MLASTATSLRYRRWVALAVLVHVLSVLPSKPIAEARSCMGGRPSAGHRKHYQPAAGQLLYNGIQLPTEQWPPNYGLECTANCVYMTLDVPKPPVLRGPLPLPYLDAPPDRINIATGRQLLIDDFLIQHRDPAWTRHWHTPVVLNDTVPLIDGVRPYHGGIVWEPEQSVWKLYHLCAGVNVCAMTSPDLVAWTPLEPPACADAGARSTPRNAVFRSAKAIREFSVNLVAHPRVRDERYVLYMLPEDGTNAMAFASPDGLDWHVVAVAGHSGDAAGGLFFNALRRVWSVSVRSGTILWMRVAKYFESMDLSALQWNDWLDLRIQHYGSALDQIQRPSLEQVMPGGHNPQRCKDLSKRNTDAYGAAASVYESVVVSMVSLWRGGHAVNNKWTDVVLAFSRDGYHFDRGHNTTAFSVVGAAARTTLAAASAASAADLSLNEPGRIDSLQLGRGVRSATEDKALIAELMRENWANAHGIMNGVVVHDDAITLLALMNNGLTKRWGVLGFHLRRDGFASMRLRSNDTDAAALLTRPLRFNRTAVWLNVDLGSDGAGALDVQILADGATIAISKPVVQSGTAVLVSWPNQAEPLAAMRSDAQRIQLQFVARGTVDLYAFWIADPDNAASQGCYNGPGGDCDTSEFAPWSKPVEEEQQEQQVEQVEQKHDEAVKQEEEEEDETEIEIDRQQHLVDNADAGTKRSSPVSLLVLLTIGSQVLLVYIARRMFLRRAAPASSRRA